MKTFIFDKKLTLTNFLICLILFLSATSSLIRQILKIDNFLIYLTDFANVILLAIILLRKKADGQSCFVPPIINFIVLAFSLVSLLGLILNNVPIKLFLWGLRNIARFIVFFYVCVNFVNITSYKLFSKFFFALYCIQFVVLLLEYLLLSVKGDYLGGLFGIEQGSNEPLIMFLNTSMFFFIYDYIRGKRKLFSLFIAIIMFFIESALSETKISFVIFPIFLVLLFFMTKKNNRSFGILICSLIIGIFGLSLLESMFPGSLKQISSISSAKAYMSDSYYGYLTFTRTTQIGVTIKYFFKNNVLLNLFGYGIGACETCSFFSSDFYNNYGYMNYRYYGGSMTLLQQGFCGLFLYFLLFIVLIVLIYQKKKNLENAGFGVQPFICLCLFSVALSLYGSLYIDFSYWIVFLLSIPFAISRQYKVRTDQRRF